MKMQNNNANKPNEKESFIEILLTALSQLGNILIIALGVIFFGIKKIFLTLKKKQNEETLYRFVKNLEEHLDESSNRLKLKRKKRSFRPTKANRFFKRKEKNNAPVPQQSVKIVRQNNKYKPKKSRLIIGLQIAAVAVSLGVMVFVIVISAKGLFGEKEASAEQDALKESSVAQGEVVLEELLNQDDLFERIYVKEKINALMGKIIEQTFSLYEIDESQSTECLDEPLEKAASQTPEIASTPIPVATMDASQTVFSQDILIHKGDTNSQVPAIQERLMDLHYMDADEPTDYYGEMTWYATSLFQRGHGLLVDGVAGYETLTLLFSEGATPYLVRKGDYGFDIKMINKRLIELGYLDDGDTGKNFNEDTDLAIRVFQGRNKLSQDGIVGYNTTQVLFNGDAKPAHNYSPPSNNDSGGSSDGGSSTGGSYNANDAASFVAYAKSIMNKGYTYIWGGKGPPGMDCSGFVYYSLKQTGNGIGYMTSAAWAQSSYQTISSIHDVKPGDILCFQGHVAICIGDGKMIDSSSSSNAIRIANFESSTYWNNKWVCGKRVFP